MRTMALVTAALLMGVSSVVATEARAQSPVDLAFAEQFLGTWAMNLETPDGGVPLEVTVQEEAGDVTIQLGNRQGAAAITDFERSGDALVLRYAVQYQGMDVPATIRVTREGEGLSTHWSFADGLYETSAVATKR